MTQPAAPTTTPTLLPGRLLTATPADLAAHRARHGPLPSVAADQLLDEVERSGLTGRGGARFPVHRKLRAVARGRRPVVIANGAEGEPASSKDKTLLTRAPHLVLDGLQVAAQAVGARRAIVYCHAGPALAALERALDERAVGRVDRLPVELIQAHGGFVSGQESAVVRAVEGGPALPRSIPPPVFQKGVDGRATLVQNVETLAHLALIARYGAAGFREAGTRDEPGTMLCSVSGAVARPGVVEVPLGTPIRQVLAAAGGADGPLRAVLVGGYHGAWLTPAQADRLQLSAADLAPVGAAPGAGVVLALSQEHCPLQASASLLGYLADASARQCGPCLNGLPALAATVTDLARLGWPPGLRDRARQLIGLVDGRGACKHPDGTARLARSVLTAFPEELDAHSRGRCLASRPARRS